MFLDSRSLPLIQVDVLISKMTDESDLRSDYEMSGFRHYGRFCPVSSMGMHIYWGDVEGADELIASYCDITPDM